MKSEEQKTALENHLSCIGNNKLKIHQHISTDKRKTTAKFFIQNGSHTLSPALKYEELNLFILGMTRAKQLI